MAVQASAVSRSISKADVRSPSEALPREVLHNLKYQHEWIDLRLHTIQSSSNPPILDITDTPMSVLPTNPERIYLISGTPPRHSYVHPDFLNHLVKHKIGEADVEVQREWVLPMSTGETWTLQKFCHVFDLLPVRDPLNGAHGLKHQDAKRVLCGMKADDGFGGDGTVVYYIMQEGEVKPRQN